MDVIADGLLIATALVAALYCAVLSSRLRRLARSDDGLGGQIGALTAAVDEARNALTALQAQASTLRRETSAASDRLRRESGEARSLAETLDDATAEARRLLNALESAPVPLAAPIEQAKEVQHEGAKGDAADPGDGGEALEGYEVVAGTDAFAALDAALADPVPGGQRQPDSQGIAAIAAPPDEGFGDGGLAAEQIPAAPFNAAETERPGQEDAAPRAATERPRPRRLAAQRFAL